MTFSPGFMQIKVKLNYRDNILRLQYILAYMYMYTMGRCSCRLLQGHNLRCSWNTRRYLHGDKPIDEDTCIFGNMILTGY